MRVRRHIRSVAAGVVALVAAIASYSHMRDLALEHGQPHYLAVLLPLSVDGMLVVASVVSAEDRDAGRPVRPWARVSFAAGVIGSVAANVLSAPDDATARVISAWPALALLLVVEMIASGQASVPAPVALEDALERRAKPEPATVATSPVLPTPVAVPVVTVSPKVPAQRRPKPQREARRRQTAAEREAQIRAVAASMPADATPEQIAAVAKTSERTVRRYLPAEPAPVVTVPDDASELLPDPSPGGVPVPALVAT